MQTLETKDRDMEVKVVLDENTLTLTTTGSDGIGTNLEFTKGFGCELNEFLTDVLRDSR